MATNAAKSKLPEAYTGPLGFSLPACIATIGAKMPAMRLNAEAIAIAVPRYGAGNTSGVYAYNTEYIAFYPGFSTEKRFLSPNLTWKNASRQENAS
jgi:hypothetical protein